ncbi:hypothetical protein BEWA_021020 [Theileria equi strain WA]|uniref:Uncharacterized protein n=1 Tax=Theileria equi strain WA TaxID=1537102 RepID=L0AUM5_THEEQ|nr:hypothetical protein BEWA_021020 [Theileria equi strain WA]AFZ79255.1 hypothetical protein BEWA_021020 [Theileria equi strain WA]|eukprot:XP_004828921.1 hypothetical protein BEWA_021020 [Theileria equi strain WA]
MTRRDVYGTNDRFLNKEWALDSSSETTTVASRTSKTDLEPSVTRDVFMEENKGCYKADKEAVIKSVTGPAEPEDDEDEDATQNSLSKHASLDSIILPFDTKETQSIDRNIESKVVENEPLLTNERLRSKIDELERHLSGANEFEDAKLQNESSFHEQMSHFLTNASISFEESLCGCDSPSIHKSGIYSAHKTTSEPRGKWEGIEIMKSLGDLSLGNSDFREETIVETGSINFKELYSHEQSPESLSVLKFQARVENLHSAPPKLECTGSHLLADSHSVQSTFHLPCDRTRSDITLLKSAKPHIGGSNLNPSQLYSIAQGFYEDEYKDSPLQACSHSSRTTLRSSKVSQELSQRTRSDEFQEEHGCQLRESQSYKGRLPQDEEAEYATRDVREKTEYNKVKSKTHPLCRVSSIHKNDPRRNRTLSLKRLNTPDTRDDGLELATPDFQQAKGRRIEKLKIRPLRHIRHKLLIDGFDATVYIINSSKRATSSLCTIMFDYDKDTLMIKSMNNLFEINATTLVSEEIPTVPNAPILLKLSVLNVKTSAVVIQSMNGRDLEILGGTIGWLENDGMGVQDDAMA